MDFQRVAIDKKSKQFGLIPNECGAKFSVLWLDGTVSESSIAESVKVIFNSPSFFQAVSPERNKLLIETQPNQLFLEILWEKKCNSTGDDNTALDARKLKELMLSLGLPDASWDKVWNDFKASLTLTPALVSSYKNRYRLLPDDFTPADPIVVDWDSIRASGFKSELGQIGVQGETLVTATEGSIKAGYEETWNVVADWNNAAQPTSPLEVFAARSSGKLKQGDGLETKGDFLGFYVSLAGSVNELKSTQRKQLLQNVSVSSDAETQLMAHMLDSHLFPNNAEAYRAAVKIGNSVILRAASDSESHQTSVKLAASKLLEVLPESATLNKPQLSDSIMVTAFVLSMSSPSLKNLKDQLVEQLCFAAKQADVNLLTRNVELKLIDILEALGWDSPQRAQLNDVLIKSRSAVVHAPEFWLGLKASNFVTLCKSAIWNSHLMSATLRPVIESEVAKLVQTVNAADSLTLFVVANQIESLLGKTVVKKLILLGLTSQSSTKKALEDISNDSEIKFLRSEAEIVNKKLMQANAEAQKTKATASILEEKIASLEAKITQAGEASEALRDGVKQQFELDAARKVGRILAFIDEQFGSDYPGKERVLTLAKSLGISSFAQTGEITSFNFTFFDDHEGKSADGDSVKVLAPGYSWGSAENSIVLLKAVVTK